MDAERRFYPIGEMCDAFGVTARALRFYEDEQLIFPERRGTTRLYTDRDRARLTWMDHRIIRRAADDKRARRARVHAVPQAINRIGGVLSLIGR